jgi:hypothetical protein
MIWKEGNRLCAIGLGLVLVIKADMTMAGNTAPRSVHRGVRRDLVRRDASVVAAPQSER